MSKTYYVFRHAQTLATKRNRGYGLTILTAGILEEGRDPIEKMAQNLLAIPTDYNVCSPLPRCRQTAQIVTLTTGKKFRTDFRVNEYLYEPFVLLRQRVQSFIHSIEYSSHQTVLVCTHGAVIAALISLLTKGHFEARDLNSYPPPGVLIKIEDGKLESWNFNLQESIFPSDQTPKTP